MTRRPKIRESGSACPTCGSQDRVPILYGLPTQEASERADRGEILLGGCIFDDRDPRWKCRVCGTEWGRSGDEA